MGISVQLEQINLFHVIQAHTGVQDYHIITYLVYNIQCETFILFFSDTILKAECLDCPPGYYCLVNSTSYNTQLCPAGFYCPLGTRHAFEYPCPKGTYNPTEGRSALADCLDCPPGQYCECRLPCSLKYKFSLYAHLFQSSYFVTI